MSNSDTTYNDMSTYSGKQAAKIVGITYRQLDYWARTDFVKPSVVSAAGSGSRRQYNYEDLLRLKVAKALLDSGIRLEKVREVFRNVKSFGADVKDANLIIEGEEVFVYDRDQLVSAFDSRQLGMFTVMSVQNVQGKLDASILDLTNNSKVEDLRVVPQSSHQLSL